MRLYLDEDSCDGRFVKELRRLGFNVLAATELGRAGLSDPDHLAYAVAEQCVLVTANVGDFHAIHGEWALAGREHFGILTWKRSVRRSPEGLAASVAAVLSGAMDGQFANALLRVPSGK